MAVMYVKSMDKYFLDCLLQVNTGPQVVISFVDKPLTLNFAWRNHVRNQEKGYVVISVMRSCQTWKRKFMFGIFMLAHLYAYNHNLFFDNFSKVPNDFWLSHVYLFSCEFAVYSRHITSLQEGTTSPLCRTQCKTVQNPMWSTMKWCSLHKLELEHLRQGPITIKEPGAAF